MPTVCEVGSSRFWGVRESEGLKGLNGKLGLGIGKRNVVRFEARGNKNVGQVLALEKGGMSQHVNGKGDGSQGENLHQISTIGNSTNIKWHCCSVGKLDRQGLLNQKGCVIWFTGLSGSGLF
ncbi:hypothetical protein MLD38_028546 [Melastoma candidum]|uniref:Uncharacterized protein n=1 Tax=Melastoma candidum TaxID=119954 RepID=A0ACB9N1E4_9MYRT|nr:hypothetical protein MLD38_028546 [Melastoma candidum]